MRTDHTEIYVIEHPNGFWKIGRAKNPDQRLKEIQCHSPYELEVRTTVTEHNDHSRRSVESLLHQYFSRYQIRGEWFCLPPDELTCLDKLDELYASDLYSVTHDLLGSARGTAVLIDHLHDVWIANYDPSDGGAE